MWLFLNLHSLAVVVFPVAARVSDISVIVCFPSIVGSTGHCVSSFVLVFLVLVGNLVIVLSPGSL